MKKGKNTMLLYWSTKYQAHSSLWYKLALLLHLPTRPVNKVLKANSATLNRKVY